jgi:hypothetical protein
VTRKRDPEAVLISDGDIVLVKHCDNIDVARPIAAALLRHEEGEGPEHNLAEFDPGPGTVIWCRIFGALPNSWAAADGYRWHYDRAAGPGRGVFRAVEFLR